MPAPLTCWSRWNWWRPTRSTRSSGRAATQPAPRFRSSSVATSSGRWRGPAAEPISLPATASGATASGTAAGRAASPNTPLSRRNAAIGCHPASTRRPRSRSPHPAATAYLGWFVHAQLRAGETVYVGGAAGNVGSAATAIARAAGARVLASARPEDHDGCRVAGADVVIDYRDPDLHERLRAAAPAGVDVFWDTSGHHDLGLTWTWSRPALGCCSPPPPSRDRCCAGRLPVHPRREPARVRHQPRGGGGSRRRRGADQRLARTGRLDHAY